jgi:FAD synthetase
MKPHELLDKYIKNTEAVLTEIELSQTLEISDDKVNAIIDAAKRYLEDAKYYRDRKRFETGLASVAYSEGLLDALRLLGVARFVWPKEKRRR